MADSLWHVVVIHRRVCMYLEIAYRSLYLLPALKAADRNKSIIKFPVQNYVSIIYLFMTIL